MQGKQLEACKTSSTGTIWQKTTHKDLHKTIGKGDSKDISPNVQINDGISTNKCIQYSGVRSLSADFGLELE